MKIRRKTTPCWMKSKPKWKPNNNSNPCNHHQELEAKEEVVVLLKEEALPIPSCTRTCRPMPMNFGFRNAGNVPVAMATSTAVSVVPRKDCGPANVLLPRDPRRRHRRPLPPEPVVGCRPSRDRERSNRREVDTVVVLEDIPVVAEDPREDIRPNFNNLLPTCNSRHIMDTTTLTMAAVAVEEEVVVDVAVVSRWWWKSNVSLLFQSARMSIW